MPRSNLVTEAFAWAKVKIMYYLEIIAAIGLKVGSNIQMNELMKLNEYQRSRSLLTLAKGHSDFKIKSCYAPAYSKNSGRALSVTPVRPLPPSVCLSIRPYVPLSCPGHNSKTLWNIFMKLHRCIHHKKTMCHEQGRQLSHFWFLNYFPLT